MAVAGAVALLLAVSAEQMCVAEQGGVKAITEPFFSCIEREARALERSKEPSREIATAVVSICRPELQSFTRAMQACGRTIESADRLATEFRQIGQDRAVAAVVKIRASRP